MDDKYKNSKDIAMILSDKFILKERLGHGSFGQLYSAMQKEDGTLIAIKVEKKQSNSIITLIKEAKVLGDLQGKRGFPILFGYGKELNFNYMAIEMLGQDLEKLLHTCHNKLSLKTTLLLMDQMLTRIEALHQKGYVHRDIKPENFCISKDTKGDLYMIDFGLARSYKDAHGKHILMTEKKGLVGTARYTSTNSHLGLEQSRRDDLESIGYSIIYLAKGKLPWQDVRAVDKNEKYALIANVKMNTPSSVLCKDLPVEFATYLNYVKKLDFTDSPDYKYLKGLFRTLFLKSGFSFDYEYDWLKPSPKEGLYSLNGVTDKCGKPVARSPPKRLQEDKKLEGKYDLKVVQLPKFESAIDIPLVKDPKESTPLSYKVVISREGASHEFIDKNKPKGSKNLDNYQFNINPNLLTGRSSNALKVCNGRKPQVGGLEHSDKNVSIFSIGSSKQLHMSKDHCEEDDIPMETSLTTAPSAKILETKPLSTRTKDSYYVVVDQNDPISQDSRSNIRKRTFWRAQSDMDMDKKTPVTGLFPHTNIFKPLKVLKQGRQEEDLEENSICEMIENNIVEVIPLDRIFTTHNKHF